MTGTAQIQPLRERPVANDRNAFGRSANRAPVPCICCQTSDCTRAYTTSLGYFNVEGSGILLDKFGKQTCPNCEASMYLAAYNPEREDETWRCARCGQKGLRHNRALVDAWEMCLMSARTAGTTPSELSRKKVCQRNPPATWERIWERN
jgi:ribosomal protein S27AE